MKGLEEKIKGDVEIINENDEMDTTFCNPFLCVSCEKCGFISKSSVGLQVQVRAKHKVIKLTSTPSNIHVESEIVAVEEGDVGNTFKCDGCEFVPETEQMLKAHVNMEHGNEKEKDKESDAVNTFKCDECEFMADTKQSLKTHVDLKHGNENEDDK